MCMDAWNSHDSLLASIAYILGKVPVIFPIGFGRILAAHSLKGYS